MVAAAILQLDLRHSVTETRRGGEKPVAQMTNQIGRGQRATAADFIQMARRSRVPDSFLPTFHAVPALTVTRLFDTTQRIWAVASRIHRICYKSGNKAARAGCSIKTNSGIAVVTALSAIALYAAAPVLAGTAVLPPNSETSYATKYTGRLIDTQYLGDGASESLVEMTGVSRNAVGQPAFDAMNADCLMLSAISGGKPRRYGACTQTDRDGDHVFTSFDGAAFRLIGGTGKYKGISGSALYSITPEPSLEPGRYGYVMENDVTWTIQSAPPVVDPEAAVRGVSANYR